MASANDMISRGVIEKVFYENSTYDIVSLEFPSTCSRMSMSPLK